MKDKESISEEKKVNRYVLKKTIVSFTILIAAFTLAIFGWRYLYKQPKDNGVLKPLRAVLNSNEKVNEVFFSEKRLAKEYEKKDAVKKVRVNGNIGMGKEFDTTGWKLTVIPHIEKNRNSHVDFNLADIKALPKREVIFDFKCIEGWNQVTHWSGARFSDFLAKYKLGTHSGNAPDINNPDDLYKYVALYTPDSAYYVGIDMKSMLHDQTILCYDMNEKQLPLNQGFPLRLIITVKYGVKSLKRIGYIYFSDTKPPDYWFEHGYVYDAAL